MAHGRSEACFFKILTSIINYKLCSCLNFTTIIKIKILHAGKDFQREELQDSKFGHLYVIEVRFYVLYTFNLSSQTSCEPLENYC